MLLAVTLAGSLSFCFRVHTEADTQQKLKDPAKVTASNINRPRACQKYKRQRTPSARKQKNKQGLLSANRHTTNRVNKNIIDTDLGKSGYGTTYHCNPKRTDKDSKPKK
jgi:hypothetical protein